MIRNPVEYQVDIVTVLCAIHLEVRTSNREYSSELQIRTANMFHSPKILAIDLYISV